MMEVCPQLARATTNKPISHPRPSGIRIKGATPRCDPAKPNRIRFLGAETEPNPVPERQNRTESGSWMPEPNRIRPPRPRNRTESGPAMAGTEPNSNLGFANRTRGLVSGTGTGGEALAQAIPWPDSPSAAQACCGLWRASGGLASG